MSAPAEILELVARFEQQFDAYKSGQYNETQLRREFLDPFFKALGWDVDNSAGYAEAYKDVIHEDQIRVGGATKAPDYCFRIGGTRKFFLEAKKPSVNIKGDVAPAYQLRRYAWSAKLPLSILSDFEELAVYDCRIRPGKNDKASVARVFYCTFRDYAEKWDWINSVFSRDAILKGSFDTFAAKKAKRGTAEVDAEFLATIEGWRIDLARNLALHNPKLTQRELNFAVQRIIDRIIFLRICEDRRIEDYGRLKALVNGARIYTRLCQLFEAADTRYNSGLFHFKVEKGRNQPPDELTLGLKIDDTLLRGLLKNLYYPDSPYEFSVLSADILGQVYEQFLGKVIRLTDGHQAKIEEKPEVRKAGGVYYTPTYIVDYIVQHTVGKLVEKKTPKQVEKLRILDPACGSGSFLIGAYQHLLDWHLQFYMAKDPTKYAKGRKPALVQTTAGWKLTIDERKRILLNNIYGVDIDSQAVEVTKLSLLLKVLEGETRQSLQPLFQIFHERALPDLSGNIKCGNSLIGPDFYQQSELPLLTDEEKYRINVFDWQTEFSEVFKAGGFNAVIGNPPYIRIQRIAHVESDYVFQRYESPTSKMDLSLVFLEKGLSLANKSGRVGFICTSQWLSADYGRNLRSMLGKGKLHLIVNFGSLPVFANTNTYPAILILSPTPARDLALKQITSREQLNLVSVEAAPIKTIQLSSLSAAPWTLGGLDLLKVLRRGNSTWCPLHEFGKAYIGCKTGLNEAFVLSRSEAQKRKLEKEILIPYALSGKEVRRYGEVSPDAVLIYPYSKIGDCDSQLISEDTLRRHYPNAHAHLISFKGRLQKRQDSRRLYAIGADWYRHLRAGRFSHITNCKLTFKGIAKQASVAVLGKNTAFDGARCPSVIIENLLGHSRDYLLGVLNSKLITTHLKGVCPAKLSGYIEFVARALSDIPIRTINFSNKSDKAAHGRMVKLVEQMLELHKQLAVARTPQEKVALERQISATDTQIDRLVYDLYGLTADEIKIVENACK